MRDRLTEPGLEEVSCEEVEKSAVLECCILGLGIALGFESWEVGVDMLSLE